VIKRGKPTKDGQVKITFTVPNDQPVGGISLVGNFNNWDPYAHPMERKNNGTYQVSLTVPSQEPILFRYLADGGVWFDDADADHHDEHGGRLNPMVIEHSPVENGAASAIKKAVRRTAAPRPANEMPSNGTRMSAS
jgi:1,4-alpha-glucan branching enzyme